MAAIAAAVAPFVVPTPFVLPSLLVITKSSAITGAAKARQTKADVPSRTLLRCFKFIVLAWGIGCMASVLEEELSREVLTIEYVSGSVSENGSQSPIFEHSQFIEGLVVLIYSRL